MIHPKSHRSNRPLNPPGTQPCALARHTLAADLHAAVDEARFGIAAALTLQFPLKVLMPLRRADEVVRLELPGRGAAGDHAVLRAAVGRIAVPAIERLSVEKWGRCRVRGEDEKRPEKEEAFHRVVG